MLRQEPGIIAGLPVLIAYQRPSAHSKKSGELLCVLAVYDLHLRSLLIDGFLRGEPLPNVLINAPHCRQGRRHVIARSRLASERCKQTRLEDEGSEMHGMMPNDQRLSGALQYSKKP
jgi:hypothetical protein